MAVCAMLVVIAFMLGVIADELVEIRKALDKTWKMSAISYFNYPQEKK